MCGAITPSVPPDMMNSTRAATSAAGRPSACASSVLKALVANPRLKSLTQPLPSVLPSRQIT